MSILNTFISRLFHSKHDFKCAYFLVPIALEHISDFSAKESYTNSIPYILFFHLLPEYLLG